MDPFTTALLDHLDTRIAATGARETESPAMAAATRRELETLRDERRWILTYQRESAVIRSDVAVLRDILARLEITRA